MAPKHTFAFIVLCAPSLHSLFPRSTVVKLSGSELLDKKSEVAPTDKGIFFQDSPCKIFKASNLVIRFECHGGLSNRVTVLVFF